MNTINQANNNEDVRQTLLKNKDESTGELFDNADSMNKILEKFTNPSDDEFQIGEVKDDKRIDKILCSKEYKIQLMGTINQTNNDEDVRQTRLKIILNIFVFVTAIIGVIAYVRHTDHMIDEEMRVELAKDQSANEYIVRIDEGRYLIFFKYPSEYGLVKKDDYGKYINGSDGDLVYKTNKGTVKRIPMNKISEIKILQE